MVDRVAVLAKDRRRFLHVADHDVKASGCVRARAASQSETRILGLSRSSLTPQGRPKVAQGRRGAGRVDDTENSRSLERAS